MIRYVSSEQMWADYLPCLESLLSSGARVLDVGGGANPSLPPEIIAAKNLDYTLLDVSQAELNKAGPAYKPFCGDITDPSLPLGDFALIFSKMVAEHVSSGRAFHSNIFRMLKPGGLAFHFFPTLYEPTMVINRLLPERLTWKLRKVVQPWTTKNGHADKFPAYYSWCRGPYSSQIRRLQSIGFEVVEYVGSFGHTYFDKLPILASLQRATASWLLRHPAPVLTVSATVTLRKPY